MVAPEADIRSFLEVVAGTKNSDVPAAEQQANAAVATAQVRAAGAATGESWAGEAEVNPAATRKKLKKKVAKKRTNLQTRLLELVKEQLRNRQVLQQEEEESHAAQETAKAPEEEAEILAAPIQPLFRLPPSRKHATGAREERVSHPIQVIEGCTIVYPVNGFDLWTVMGEVEGWSLPLGEAHVRGGDVIARAAEEFSVVCGFSAAFGPLLLEHATAKVYGGIFFRGAHELPLEHLSHLFATYWECEVAPFDSAERFFRLVGNPVRGGIGRVRGSFW